MRLDFGPSMISQKFITTFCMDNFYIKIYDVPMKFASRLIHGGQVHLCHTQVYTVFHVVSKSQLVISVYCVMLTS